MVLQRSRARHAQLVSHELETGGSDADLPDFWEDEDELDPIRLEDRAMHSEDVSMLNVIRTALGRSGTGHREFGEEDEEDRWAREAAEAEEAEWKAEELEIVRRVEKAYGMGTSTARDGGDQHVRMGVDWEAFDAMDIE